MSVARALVGPSPYASKAPEPAAIRSGLGRRVLGCMVAAVLPLTAMTELVAGELQRRHVPRVEDWRGAAMAAKAMLRPSAAAAASAAPADILIVSPRWASPLGDMAFDGGREPVVDTRSVARSDLETYGRVIELSIRGKDAPEVRAWRRIETRKFGQVSVRLFENPSAHPLVRDLVSDLDAHATVARVSPEGVRDPCKWETGGFQHLPSLGAGPVPSPNRWLCPPGDPTWNAVGPTVILDVNYVPRRCLFMHPVAGVTTIEYPPGPVGKTLVGYVGLHVWAERELAYAPVLVRASVGGRVIATARHVDGDGWLRFEGSTADFAGTQQTVKLESWAENDQAGYRHMCVSAELRN